MTWAVCLLLLGTGIFRRLDVLAQRLDAELCEKTTWANASEVPFSWSNNAWGNITGQATGHQCLRVYDSGKSWTATYQWSGDPTLVKAYPRMQAWPSNMPLQLRTLSQLLVNANFKTYTTDGGDNDAAYNSAGLIANVALDLFLAPTAEGSTQISPPIEIMIWPWWTPTILPLGYTASTPDKDTVQVNGATWSLYHGLNAGGQNVFSWLARSNVTSLDGDYAPLIAYLVNNNYLAGDLWASQLQFGQEMKQALKETNFHVEASDFRLVRANEGEMSVFPSSSPVQSSTSLSPVTSSVPFSSSTGPALVTTTTAIATPAPAPSTLVSSGQPIATTIAPPEQSQMTSIAPSAVSLSSSTTTNTQALRSSATTTLVAPIPTIRSSTLNSSVLSGATTSRPTTVEQANTTAAPATTSQSAVSGAATTTTTSNAAAMRKTFHPDSWLMVMLLYILGHL